MRHKDVFEAVANPTRRALLDLLRIEPRPVNDLAEHFKMRRASVSEHLRVLRDAGLVRSERSGRQQIYQLEAARLKELATWLHPYEEFWGQRTRRLRALLDADQTDG